MPSKGFSVSWNNVKLRAAKKAGMWIIRAYLGIILALSILDLSFFTLSTSHNSKIIWILFAIKLIITKHFRSFLFLLAAFSSRISSFQAHRESSIINDAMGIIFVLTAVSGTFHLAQTLATLSFKPYQLTLCFVSFLQYEFNHRLNDGNKCRLLEKQILDRTYYLSVVREGVFQIIFSIAVTIAISFILTFVNVLSFILPIFSYFQLEQNLLASLDKLKYIMFEFLIRDSTYSSSPSPNFIQFTSIVLSTYLVIVLSLIFTELLNRYSNALDGVISHQIQAIPQCNEINFQDECILARALGNYGRGVSYMIGLKSTDRQPKALMAGILQQAPMSSNPCTRSPPEPVSVSWNPTMNNFYDETRHRHQTDPVVYKMLLDPNSILWKTYVDSGLRVIRESCYHLVTLSSYMNQSNDSRQEMEIHVRLFVEPNLVGNFNACLADGVKIRLAMDMITLSILYIRGITCWLCIANMLGCDSFSIKRVAKDIIGESISLLKTTESFSGYKFSNSSFSNLLSTLENEISLSLKQLCIYTETLLFTKFDSSFDTYRVIQHLYGS